MTAFRLARREPPKLSDYRFRLVVEYFDSPSIPFRINQRFTKSLWHRLDLLRHDATQHIKVMVQNITPQQISPDQTGLLQIFT